MLSCPCALIKARFSLTFAISSTENVTVDKRLSVIYLKLEGSELLLETGGKLFFFFNKKRVEKLGFFLEICYKAIFVKERRHNRHFLII